MARKPRKNAVNTTEANNTELAGAFWQALYSRDWQKVAGFFDDASHYEDVPAPDRGADGARAITGRLRIGLESIDGYRHECERIVAQGDVVVTEHTEHWSWSSGEQVSLPFVSVQVIAEGRIRLWRDYWNLPTLLDGAPGWWLEHIMQFDVEDFERLADGVPPPANK
ncbi:MAG TPA: nuclear transport factor 2 family protein [Deltaproteobacteria bacterium]|nr:nuclear transport factor 2 family protein [Candidatus Binatota bacterium]HIL13968.1 nuclear transport factor 2 family protein [Deltaproteobacteria bacterium]